MITGEFYEEELQKTFINDDTTYKIERIIKKRKRNGKKEIFLKWMGYNFSFNCWIPEDNIVKDK